MKEDFASEKSDREFEDVGVLTDNEIWFYGAKWDENGGQSGV